MRNSKRVRFFRRLIYTFIVILLFLPLILTSFLSMRLISRMESVEQRLGELETANALAVMAAATLQEPQNMQPETHNPALDDGLTDDLSQNKLSLSLQNDKTQPDYLDDPVPEEEPANNGADTQASEVPSILQPAPLTGR